VIVARRFGEDGFASFAKVLHRLGVLSYSELLDALAFHGALLRTALPLDAGDGVPEELLDWLREDLES
jgi:hypothetical protein